MVTDEIMNACFTWEMNIGIWILDKEFKCDKTVFIN